VVVKEIPGEEQRAKRGSSESSSNDTLNGVAVTDLNPQTRQQYSVAKNVQGAVVTQVDPTSAAADAGVKEGDVIMEINKHPVRSADDAVRLTTNVKDKITLLRVWSANGSHYLTVDESKAS
jgi:serine protease Do